jgi:hypothetical protein
MLNCAHMPAKSPTPQRREKRLEVRLDPDLFQTVSLRSVDLGGVSVLVRALLRKYAAGEITLSAEDFHRELITAPKRQQRAWTAAEISELRQLARFNTPLRVICIKLDRTRAAVLSKAAEAGIELRPKKR